MANKFGNLERQRSNRELKTNKGDFRAANIYGQHLGRKKLKKTVARRYAQFQKNPSGDVRSRLLGLRRALTKRTLGKDFKDLTKTQRRRQLKKKLGSDFGTYFHTKPKRRPAPPPGEK